LVAGCKQRCIKCTCAAKWWRCAKLKS
jgi:hypothetical protein